MPERGPVAIIFEPRRGWVCADRFGVGQLVDDRDATRLGDRSEDLHDTIRLERVGFGRGFSVKVSSLWADEDTAAPISESCKHFKWLAKITGKGEAAKGDVYHIERSGAHLDYQIRLRPAQVASGVRVISAQNQRNPPHVGPLSRHAKLEYRRDRI